MPVFGYCPWGTAGVWIRLEADLRRGLPGFDLVGLAAGAVQESRDRVRAALRNQGFDFPLERVLVNLAPSDVPKQGAGLDLAVAVAVLQASGQLPNDWGDLIVLGELGLGGQVRPCKGVLGALTEARRRGIRRALVPAANVSEAAQVPDLSLWPVSQLRELAGPPAWQESESLPPSLLEGPDPDPVPLVLPEEFWRALECVASGGHGLLIYGPPGCGKTLASQAVEALLPPWGPDEAWTVSRLWSDAGLLPPGQGLLTRRPVRRPHHGASREGLTGGGPGLSAGEFSLAHGGLLILDEALEFRAPLLQALREPLEEGALTLSRAGRQATFPAAFQVLLTTNLCPCGQRGAAEGLCLCAPAEVAGYWRRLGAPVLDRLDLRLNFGGLPPQVPRHDPEAWSRRRRRIRRARARQQRRNPGGQANARVPGAWWVQTPGLWTPARESEARLRGLTSRACVGALRLAQTLADLEAAEGPDEAPPLDYPFFEERHWARALAWRAPRWDPDLPCAL